MLRRFVPPFILAIACAAAVCAGAAAQTAQDVPGTGFKVKPLNAKPVPMPFPPGSERPDRAKAIEFRTAGQMSEKDRLIEAGAEASIQERTTWAGMEFGGGGWNYRQVVCTALPNHLFLQFTRNSGAGDVSVFSASIPRGGEGRVRIIPIQKRGYSLFSPAPINALTISAFNHIRAEENPAAPPDWLATGLCYAALAGASPETVLLTDDAAPQKFPAASPAILEIPGNGGAVIRFADVAASPRPMEWTMTFNGKGKLLKATHAPAALVTATATPQAPADLKGTPMHQAIVDAPSTQNP
jgi:hypothetical protein